MIAIDFDIVSTLIIAIFLYLLGNFLTNKIYILNKFCIPSPVVGGILFSSLVFLLKYFKITSISMNTYLMPYFMSFFFTIVGLNVSLKLIKKGGKTLIIYWLLCGFLGFFQNIITFILSKVVNINPLLALMCGNISMEGGHGYSLAFGTTIEGLGISNACNVGFASATLGLIMGGIVGGPVAKHLIDKYNLKSKSTVSKNTNKNNTSSNLLEAKDTVFFEQILVVLLCMTLGDLIAYLIKSSFNIIIPGIVGCILVAVIFRNLNDKVKFINLDFNLLDFLEELSLGLFLTMALMSIDFYTLSDILGPILIIVITQVLFLILFSITVCFNLLGRNYDAAVIISGLLGHGLGATPNALANMGSVTEKYGYSDTAFLVVPLVAAFLLDLFNMPCILLFINLLK